MTTTPEGVPLYGDGTAGHQGAASKDAEPRRRSVVDLAVHEVRDAGTTGVTWRDLADSWGCHHGVASSALSNAHRGGAIVRLAMKRDGCGVYVTPSNVAQRATIEHRSNRKPTTVTREEIANVVYDWMQRPAEHEEHLIARLDFLINPPQKGPSA